jgi:hypothetical protein
MNHASAHRPALRVRLRVRVHRGRLDRELAQGFAAGLSTEHTARAKQLSEPPTRAQLARSLRRVVSDVEDPTPLALSSKVPVRRHSVEPWREGLLGLAERLEQPRPVNPCGVARALILLTDGASPLYNSRSAESMSDLLWWVVDGLQPCPPHEWSCPKVMKLDPEHVAWTCKRCGTIATSDQAAVGPA